MRYEEDYFSQYAILKRLNRRHRRFTFLAIHFLITLVILVPLVTNVSVFGMLWRHSRELAATWSGFLQSLPEITPVAVGIVFFSTFALNLTLAVLKTHAENEIHEQMREARYYASRRHDLEPRAVLRVEDDGEFVDELDEMDYELKPKRKRM